MKRLNLVIILLLACFSVSFAARIKKSTAHDEYVKYEKIKPKKELSNIPYFFSATVISITNQEEFDGIMSSINNAVSQGATQIIIEFSPGRYYFKERHIDFANKDYHNIAVRFIGNGAYFIGSNKVFVSGESFGEDFDNSYAYIDDDMNPVSFWGKMHTTDKELEVVDKASKLCRIHYEGIKDYSESECMQVFIFTSQSYRAKSYKVKYIKSNYVYFIADDLASLWGTNYNINFDYVITQKKEHTRFKLCNIPGESENYVRNGKIILSNKYKRVYQCNIKTLFHFSKSNLRYVEVKGFNICGNRATYRNHPQSLIYLANSSFQSGFYVHDCTFSSLKSQAMNASNTCNIQLSNNKLKYLYDQGFDIDNSCSDIYITYNEFSYCGLDLDIDGCVRCAGRNYYIGYNTFQNFGYSAIKLGNYHCNNDVQGSKGVAEYNNIYYTDDYVEAKHEYTMMDSGAIYLFTQNEKAIVRYNRICNYTGMNGNTGIYLDDGAYNVIIYGNVVLNIHNDRNIYSRRSAIEENASSSKTVTTSNTGNVILYNIVDGPCMFVANETNSNCYQGYNVVLNDNNASDWANVIENFDKTEEDFQVHVEDIAPNGTISLERSAMRSIKRLPTYKKMKILFKM